MSHYREIGALGTFYTFNFLIQYCSYKTWTMYLTNPIQSRVMSSTQHLTGDCVSYRFCISENVVIEIALVTVWEIHNLQPMIKTVLM